MIATNETASLGAVLRRRECTPKKAAASSPESATPELRCQIFRDPPDGIAADWEHVDRELVAALKAAVRGGKWPVTMFGATGRGKTSAMACMYRSHRRNPLWLGTSQQFVRRVQQFRPNEPAAEAVYWRKIADASFTCLDDLGVVLPTESAYGIMQELIDTRRDRPAIYTSNLDLQQLADVLDERVASRLASGTLIRVKGADRRLQDAEVVTVGGR